MVQNLPLTPAVLAALVALRPKTRHQCLLLTYSQGTPTSTEHTPGPRLAASATGIPALPGPDAHTLVSASTFDMVSQLRKVNIAVSFQEMNLC